MVDLQRCDSNYESIVSLFGSKISFLFIEWKSLSKNFYLLNHENQMVSTLHHFKKDGAF